MDSTIPPKKIEEMQNNLVKGSGNYSSDKQYSCESYILILTHYLRLESKLAHQWRIERHLSLCHPAWKTFDKIQPNSFSKC